MTPAAFAEGAIDVTLLRVDHEACMLEGRTNVLRIFLATYDIITINEAQPVPADRSS
jgi:hypothetical protein